MNIEDLRTYCLSLPLATEDTGLGEEYLLFRVMGKIFACLGLERTDYFVLKMEPDYAIDLRDRHPEIRPAWHWNKKYWSEVSLVGSLPDDFIQSLIRHSYSQVVKKLPRRTLTANPALTTVTE